jgi:hypothetical protein
MQIRRVEEEARAGIGETGGVVPDRPEIIGSRDEGAAATQRTYSAIRKVDPGRAAFAGDTDDDEGSNRCDGEARESAMFPRTWTSRHSVPWRTMA